jgi:protein ImuB
MAFACIYIPDFLVQSVVRAEPALRDAPLALISGSPPLWSVVAANPAAFDVGIQLGMTKSQSAQFCNVQVCHRSESAERAAHAALLDAAWSVSPRVEDTAPDSIVLDLEGLSSLFGSDENIASELAQRVSRISLIPRIAIASNMEVAIHAARGFTGVTIIPEGEERRRLSSLPVKALATNTEVLEVLERWGVTTFQDLAALPVLQLSERLGQEGVRLHELARGERQRSLVLAQPGTHFAEEMELDDSVEELEPLAFLLGRLLDQLCARLETRALAVQAIHVRFELEPSFEKDFQVKEDSRKKPPAKRYVKTLGLPVPMRNPKTLLKLLRLQLQNDPPKAPIQKIRLSADSAAPRVAQGGLFIPCAPDPEKLELTIARLAKLVGESNVGSPELLDSHRVDNFRVIRFVVPDEKSKRRQKKNSHTAVTGTALNGRRIASGAKAQPLNAAYVRAESPDLLKRKAEETPKPIAGFRMVRPSMPIKVEIREEQPARVWLRGMRGNVVAASGPWRNSGEWWQEDAWHQDEWDVQIEFAATSAVVAQPCPERRRGNAAPVDPVLSAEKRYHPKSEPFSETHSGLYRIYFDALRQAWFLRGIYD